MIATEPNAPCYAPETARRMAVAASRFLDALDDDQRAVASFAFEGDERYQWHYTPVERNGLRLKEMSATQRDAALALFDSGLSAAGARTARQIIALEPILRETERIEGITTEWLRDPERYAFSVFGTPGGAEPWAWRAGGHHIGVHFTVVARQWVAPTPLFFGANPATVRHGEQAGLRALPDEEDLARILLGSLEPALKRVAVVDATAPDDILTRNYRRAIATGLPSGVPYGDLSGEQRAHLTRLIRCYLDRTASEVSDMAWASIERAGLDGIHFAWAGAEERGQGHYYAITAPTFLIEYDNTQNGANHIHSVWRDLTNDWGEDLLARHYERAEHHAGSGHSS